MENDFELGGCDLIWKIENFAYSMVNFDSPIFYLDNSQKTDWYLRINFFSAPSFSCYLESPITLNNKNVCFAVSISSEDETVENSGILTFQETSYKLLAKFPLKRLFLKSLLIKSHLRDISHSSSLLHRLTFRTIEEIETRKATYDIPHFKELLANDVLTFQVLPVCQKSIRLEMKIWVTFDGYNMKIIHINIIDSSKFKTIFKLISRISAEDPNGKHITSVTKDYSFQEKEDRVCSFEIPFTTDVLKTFSSSNHKLSLKCEFLTAKGKIISWIEESTTLPVQTVNLTEMYGKCFEKENINIADDFLCLYLEGKFTDVIISVQGHKFPVHKTILSARSPVFAAMFEADMKEKENKLVEIEDVEPETVDQMIVFIYSDILKAEEYGDILKLYELADKYQVLTLKDKCSMILKKFLGTQNALEMLILSDMHYDTELQNAVEIFICGHTKTVFKTKEWEILIEEKPTLGCRVMNKFIMENM